MIVLGAVYVYHRPSMPGDDDAIIDWKFVAKLKPPSSYGPGILDFGLKCAYDNGVLAVGATRQNSVNNFTRKIFSVISLDSSLSHWRDYGCCTRYR